ncbi:hypothetical protein [Halobiforma nitratireducens]|uniref:Uncharacterized protein n=1 Tax=Halobiforma nitratireducens JCM 10879 TaxID=1227454 RepID=M0LXJ9_9EURY|nr:hypothetical protein [Halobiforma nitratireducens]EMA36830.1 hypothetical protein C446_11112 [Halobiforma nitratireducens JCM 10879]
MTNRRSVLGAIAAGIGSLAGCVDADGKWVAADVPTDAALYDVATAADGAYAVGEDGILLERTDGDWSIRLEGGPDGAGDAFRAATATNNGRTLWVAGDGGTLALYDVVADRIVDFSAPRGATSSWTAVAAAGLSGEERLSVVNSSGELFRGRRDGPAVEWADPIKPGSGSSVTDVALTALTYGYAVDTDGGVFESRDGDVSWTQIGIDGAGVDFETVAAIDDGHVSVAGGDGTVFAYDGVAWSRTSLGEQPIVALARERYDALAVSAAGVVYERNFDGWTENERLEVGVEPHSVALGTARTPQVIVGESGTAFERRY